MSTSRLWQKVGASAVNCSLVLLVSAPFYLWLGAELWKIATIAIFFLYNICFRKRCLGMRLVGTFIEPPTTLLYATLYSCGFATFFYSVWFPMDLLAVNGTLQVTSLAMTGNTLHANLAGQGTMSREDYLAQAKRRAGGFWIDGKLHEAVHSLVNDLQQWPDLRIADFMVDVGWTLADESDHSGVRLWIDGVQ